MSDSSQKPNMKKYMPPMNNTVTFSNNTAIINHEASSTIQTKATARGVDETRHRNSLTISIVEEDAEITKNTGKITQNSNGYQK